MGDVLTCRPNRFVISIQTKKIVIIGPESTGKSNLSESLAGHFDTRWCPEYAREYLLRNGKKYTYEDLLEIAKGQLALEDELFAAVNGKKELFIIDTDMYVMKVWCEFVYGKCHRFILEQIAARKYDLYLLCNTDLDWEADELREYPDPVVRERLYRTYKDLLVHQETPWFEIRGQKEQRTMEAVRAIENFLQNK